jgi:glycosyltransferase involved in cell wall biosynthesis
VLVPLQQYEVVRRFRPDVVVTVTKSMNLAARVSLTAFGRRRTAWIAREGNNTGAMIDSEATSGFLRRVEDAAVRGCYRSADAVVAISDGVASGLTTRFGLDPSHVRTVFNAVDLDAVRARAAETPETPFDRPFIVAAGRLDSQKGFDLLIRAYADRLGGRGLSLIILGDGPEREALVQLARELGVGSTVHLPGFVANPWAYFSRAALFVCSSRWEGFGNVIIEAMACGTPVVVTDCDFGPREIVRHGKTGLIVPVDDAAALGTAMASVVDDGALAARLASAGIARARDFGVQPMARAYEALFREIVRQRT